MVCSAGAKIGGGTEPEAEVAEAERSSIGTNKWDAKTLVSDDERGSRDDETLWGIDAGSKEIEAGKSAL